jgi:hypothetical protein
VGSRRTSLFVTAVEDAGVDVLLLMSVLSHPPQVNDFVKCSKEGELVMAAILIVRDAVTSPSLERAIRDGTECTGGDDLLT